MILSPTAKKQTLGLIQEPCTMVTEVKRNYGLNAAYGFEDIAVFLTSHFIHWYNIGT